MSREAFRYLDDEKVVIVTYENLIYCFSGIIGGLIGGWLLHGAIIS